MPTRAPRRVLSAIQLIVGLTLLAGWLLVLLLRSETFWMYVNLGAQAWLGAPSVSAAGSPEGHPGFYVTRNAGGMLTPVKPTQEAQDGDQDARNDLRRGWQDRLR